MKSHMLCEILSPSELNSRYAASSSGRFWALTVPFALALLFGCADGKPVNPKDQKVTGYFPLRVGHSWTYEVKTGDQISTKTRTIDGENILRGLKTFMQSTSQADLPTAVANVYPYGGRSVRLREQHFDATTGDLVDSIEYDPGLLDFADSLAAPGDAVDETHTRSEYDPGDALLSKTKEHFAWLVEAADVEKAVLGETFVCLQVQRTDKQSGEIRRLYFSQGVGKVLEETLDEQGAVVDSEALKEFSPGE